MRSATAASTTCPRPRCKIGGVAVEDHHPADSRQLTRDNHVADNVITRAGQDYYDAPGTSSGIRCARRSSTTRSGELPYSGITFGWGWGMTDPGGTDSWNGWLSPPALNGGWAIFPTPTTSSGNRVLANRIDDYLNVLKDGGRSTRSAGRARRGPTA